MDKNPLFERQNTFLIGNDFVRWQQEWGRK
jgi:hypothetical protein